MAETLRLEIITPQAIVFSEDVNMVTLPAIDGQIGVYPHHVRLITQIVPGEIIVNLNGQDRSLAVGEGLVEISAHEVAIVTDMAIPAEHIDEAKVEEARAARGSPAQGKDLRRGSRHRQRVACAIAGAAACEKAAPDVSPRRVDDREVAEKDPGLVFGTRAAPDQRATFTSTRPLLQGNPKGRSNLRIQQRSGSRQIREIGWNGTQHYEARRGPERRNRYRR